MEKTALEKEKKKSLGLLEWGVLHYEPQLHNMANEFLLRGVLPSYRKKAGSASLWSPPFPPCHASYLTSEPTKGPLHCLQRPIERERWHVHMQLSPVYSGAQSECMCVFSLTCNIAHTSSLSLFTLRSVSISVFHIHTHTTVDSRGTGRSWSSRLHGLALACLLPFLFCSSARSPFPSMYWRWVEAYHPPTQKKKRKRKMGKQDQAFFLFCFGANMKLCSLSPCLMWTQNIGFVKDSGNNLDFFLT